MSRIVGAMSGTTSMYPTSRELLPLPLLLILQIGACADSRPHEVEDRILEIPMSQQRMVTRNDLGGQWPFTIGIGTLGCNAAAVMFRADGRTYAINDAARNAGFASVEPIRIVQSRGWPSNPLKSLPQDARMNIFEESIRCERMSAALSYSSDPCKRRLRETHILTDAQLSQIEAEGRERLWPPLESEHVSLGPLVEVGLKLCSSAP